MSEDERKRGHAVSATLVISARRRRLALAGLDVAIMVAIAVGIANAGPATWIWSTVSPIVVIGAYVVAGWIGWGRRPDSGIGKMLLITGAVFGAGWLVWVRVNPLFTIGWLVGLGTYEAILGHMLLAFPTGRLRSRGERVLVGCFYVSAIVGNPIAAMFADPKEQCACLPRNLGLIWADPGMQDALWLVTSVTGAVLTIAFIAVLVRHWRAAAPMTRRALAVVYWAGALGGTVIALGALADALDAGFVVTDTWQWIRSAVVLAVPLLFLVGLLRLQLTRGALGDLVVELGTDVADADLRDALARRVGDPTLELRYRVLDGSWVSDDGTRADRPTDAEDRRVHLLEDGGEPFAAVITDDRTADEVPEVLEGVVAAARLALANDRLRAEVRAQLEEVQASRRRIVEAADAARRKVERDLHDGAQQRLVALSLGLRALQGSVDDQDARSLIDGLQTELRAALAELRELARGLHPTILTEEGLGAAVESLAERSAVPVTVTVEADGRLPAPVEATAYFVVAESLTNTAKYAGASSANVRIARSNGRLLVDVSDDGAGGATIGAGSGLTGLLDRVAAIGGTLRVESPAGGGTIVRAEIPAT